MKLAYEKPEMKVRKYALPPSDSVLTTSLTPEESTTNNLGDGTDYGDLFG